MKKKLEKVNDVGFCGGFNGLTPRYGTTGKAYDPNKPMSQAEMEKLVEDFGAKDPDIIEHPGYMAKIQDEMMSAMSRRFFDSSIKYMVDNDLTFNEMWGDVKTSNKIMWARSLIAVLGEGCQDENAIYFYAVWLASIKGI